MPASDQRVVDPNRVPLLDIVAENHSLNEEILTAIRDVFESGRFVNGPAVPEFEEAVAAFCGTEYAVGCASGSDAVLLSLMALDVGPGDEVIVPSFTFFATASAVWRLGAKIVFVDIDPITYNILPMHVEAAITSRTKAIIPVHLYGQCANMTGLGEVAGRADVALIEDAAQAIGASHRGRVAGSWGDVGCFSFYPTKNLGACGDAGIMTTNDRDLAERLRLLGNHGMNPRYLHKFVGANSRLDSIQAAALSIKLRELDRWTEVRRENAKRYCELFDASLLGEALELPADDQNGKHVWNQFTIRVSDGKRDALRSHLTADGIASEIYYPIPLHRQECFAELGYATGSLPESERAADEVLSLPIFAGITAEEQTRVVDSVRRYFTRAKASAA